MGETTCSRDLSVNRVIDFDLIPLHSTDCLKFSRLPYYADITCSLSQRIAKESFYAGCIDLFSISWHQQLAYLQLHDFAEADSECDMWHNVFTRWSCRCNCCVNDRRDSCSNNCEYYLKPVFARHDVNLQYTEIVMNEKIVSTAATSDDCEQMTLSTSTSLQHGGH